LASRQSLIVALAILVAITTGGAFWLVRLATAGAQSDGVPSPALPTADASPTLPGLTPTPSDPAASPTAVPSATPSQSQTPGRSRSPVPSITPTRQRGTTPPVPSRAIQVGGATLDNDSPRTYCAGFRNTKFAIPVVITGIDLSGSDLGTGVTIDASICAGKFRADFPATVECKAGLSLRPGGPGCYTGIKATRGPAGVNHPGNLGLRLKARCTSGVGAPCSAAELAASPPTPSRPVDVHWNSDPELAVCYVIPPDGDENNAVCSGPSEP